MFSENQKYSRKTVAEKFENKIFENNRLGKWDTTLVSHDDNLVIFMNINVPGKSGHFFYNNYIASTKEVTWYGRPGTHSDQPLMQRLIQNQISPFIFARWDIIDQHCKELTTAPNTTPDERSKYARKVKRCLKNAGIK